MSGDMFNKFKVGGKTKLQCKFCNARLPDDEESKKEHSKKHLEGY